ncbi:polyprenol monophosphomannose synthase [bacterium]|nr:MAG: polyprenol monophosphomannose synthase [bacterium]
MNLIIVIPAYNEKDNIRPLAEEILRIEPRAKILLVDDNSPDGTGEIADVLAKQNPRVTVLRRERKEGLGRAYIAGFKQALKMGPDYIIQMDADFSHDPKYIPRFLEEIETCDLAIGSRFLAPGKLANVSALSILANLYTRFILNLKITDCLGGFKCFRAEALEKIGLERFISKGFVFQAEFTYRFFKIGNLCAKEFPIAFNQRKSGKTKKSINIVLEALLKVPLLRLLTF